LKIQFLAKKIGITRQSLTSKIDGVHDFRVQEAAKLSELLGLTKAQRDTIFFS
jgi:DNA-binding XRE family transcriptional regulator